LGAAEAGCKALSTYTKKPCEERGPGNSANCSGLVQNAEKDDFGSVYEECVKTIEGGGLEKICYTEAPCEHDPTSDACMSGVQTDHYAFTNSNEECENKECKDYFSP